MEADRAPRGVRRRCRERHASRLFLLRRRARKASRDEPHDARGGAAHREKLHAAAGVARGVGRAARQQRRTSMSDDRPYPKFAVAVILSITFASPVLADVYVV